MVTAESIRQIQQQGYAILRAHFPPCLVENCRAAFWPHLLAYLAAHPDQPNRGPHRHYLPMPFDPPCFAAEFFFDPSILDILRGLMDRRIVADQWGCDVPLRGSDYQDFHIDHRPLFAETPDLLLPPYILIAAFSLVPVAIENGPIEIVPGTHRLPTPAALQALQSGELASQPLLLEPGDVLIRHPWTLHRGTPNTTDMPRPLVSIRYVRRWYVDDSRPVHPIPRAVWRSLTPAQQEMMRFPLAG